MFCQRSLGPRGSVLFESRKVWAFGFRKALPYSASELPQVCSQCERDLAKLG